LVGGMKWDRMDGQAQLYGCLIHREVEQIHF